MIDFHSKLQPCSDYVFVLMDKIDSLLLVAFRHRLYSMCEVIYSYVI